MGNAFRLRKNRAIRQAPTDMSFSPPSTQSEFRRLRLAIRGAVQGVGFRPFVYRLATELHLAGWVNNSAEGVFVEVEGAAEVLEEFRYRIEAEKPPRSQIRSLEAVWLPIVGYSEFEIKVSESGDRRSKSAVVLPDLATCPDCLRDIFDPQNRRFRYPFTNCTNCGPRYSIIKTLPYDRGNTTMGKFRMCPQCETEYRDPRDRRFHAQPNACPVCGPKLQFWDCRGEILAEGDRAVSAAADALRRGEIVALKGLGGFQLLADARNAAALRQLRIRKHRPDKPFAVMYPSWEQVRRECRLWDTEQELLRSPESPVVLLSRRSGESSILAAEVAPNNPNLGVMLPYTPLHHLLMAELGFPVVATSGNFSNEPICTEEGEALQRLGQIADRFLVHDRPIARPVDDSVVRVIGDRVTVIRRARGYAPLPAVIWQENSHNTLSDFILSQGASDCKLSKILAVGGHLKNTVAVALEGQVFLSQHIGNLENPRAIEAFKEAIESLSKIYDFRPDCIACDAHPDYYSTQFAYQLSADIFNRENREVPVILVQHHYAHVLSSMAENKLSPPVLGVAWDGTGYGSDGTIWGGEFLLISDTDFERIGHWRTFRLPGGDKAVLEPRRAAVGLLYELWGDELLERGNLKLLKSWRSRDLKLMLQMLGRNINSPQTSSAGRLFDAIAAWVGLGEIISFEGQAAMGLEFAIADFETDEFYPVNVIENADSFILDWEPMVLGIIADLDNQIDAGFISAKFHNSLAEAIVTVAGRFPGIPVALTGGCFQNRYLSERAIARLRSGGVAVYCHSQVPPNDGGLAVGQAMAIARLSKKVLNYRTD